MGVVQGFALENLDETVSKRFPQALDLLKRAGARLSDESLKQLEDMVRVNSKGGVQPAEAFTVHRALKEKGPVRVPREFVFMDRAAIGLGGVFLHLAAKLNYHRLFNEAIERFSIDDVAERQRAALVAAGLGALPK